VYQKFPAILKLAPNCIEIPLSFKTNKALFKLLTIENGSRIRLSERPLDAECSFGRQKLKAKVLRCLRLHPFPDQDPEFFASGRNNDDNPIITCSSCAYYVAMESSK
jgi:hypothetical protein